MNIAKRILQLCDEFKISVNRLAELSCLTQSTVQHIVSEQSTTAQISTIEKICDGVGITLSDFFNDDVDLPPEALRELKIVKDYLRYKYANHE